MSRRHRNGYQSRFCPESGGEKTTTAAPKLEGDREIDDE